MLKKLTASLLLTAFLAIILSGCSFIVKNEQRDSEQAVAEITYGGRYAYVTKGELANIYNQQGYYYVYYYGMTAEETFDQLVESLSNSALLGLKAKEYLSTLEGVTVTDTTKNIQHPSTELLIKEMKQMLTDKQIKEAVEATNDTFKEAYDEFVKEVEEENATPDEDTDEEEDEDEEEEETAEEPRPNPPSDEDEDENEPVVIPQDFFTAKEAELKEQDAETQEIGREALRRLKKSLERQYKDYDYYFSNQLLQKVIDRYEEEFKKGITVTDQEINARYNEMLASNIETFEANADAYATALKENPKDIIYHPGYDNDTDKGYFFVKNILMKFSDEQTADLDAFKNNKVASEEAIEDYRDYLASQIKVNVSNPDYDADLGETEENQMYSRKDVPVQTIMDEIEADLNACTTLKEKLEKYIDWTYLVNDDPGVFTALSEEKPDYLVTPEGEKSDYVTEFTELARSLYEKGEGAYGLNPDELSYCVTDFGIHLIMVSYIPFDYLHKQGSDEIAVDVENDRNLLTLNAVIDPIEGTTLKEYIEETLKDEKGENQLSVVKREFYKANKDTAVKTYPKTYKDLLKEAQKLEEAQNQ